MERIYFKKTMDNRLILNSKFVEYLIEQPENGMGYQIIDIHLKNGVVLKNRIVLNSTFLRLDVNERITNDDIDLINLSST